MLNNWWIGSCILLLFGLLFAAVSLIMKYLGSRETRHLRVTEAKVVDIVAEPRTGSAAYSEFRNRQAAVFEFYADGKLIKLKDKSDTYPCPYYIGQRLKICYDPANPQDFSIVQVNKWNRAAFAMNYLSVVCFVLGCILFLMHASRVEL